MIGLKDQSKCLRKVDHVLNSNKYNIFVQAGVNDGDLTLIRVDIDAFESLLEQTDIIHMSHRDTAANTRSHN